MSGRFGIHTGAVGHGGTAADIRFEGKTRGFRDTLPYESLPAVFRKAGLRAVSVNPFADDPLPAWLTPDVPAAHNKKSRTAWITGNQHV